MKILCIGTFLRILKFCKIPKEKLQSLFASLLKIVRSEPKYIQSDFHNGLMNGKYNLSDYEDIETFNKESLVSAISTKISPCFTNEGQRLAIACIRQVLAEDTTITDLTTIGFESEGYTKTDILNKQIFNFSSLIANVFYFTALKENTIYKSSIKEITETFIEGQKANVSEIILDEQPSKVHSKVKLSLNPKLFTSVFSEIKNISISIPNPNELKIYCLNVTNSKIDYDGIQKFVANNIGRYIYSRGIRNNYTLEDKVDELAVKAIRAYNKKVKADPSTNHFNELMLCSFLECVLGAPKIFSKMELQNKSGEYESTSSGMHILSINKGGVPFNQLIFGATDTIDSLVNAVDNALNQVIVIKDNTADEFELIESTILNDQFDAETNKALVEMIIPKKGSGLSKPDSAFGLFLGYTVDVPPNPDNLAFKNDLKIKMQDDIDSIAPYIESKIKSLKLDAYSFYIYILPLNNALIDKQEIMENALGVGK